MKPLLNTMLTLSASAHAGQFDKGGMPYILHPLTVMYKLRSSDEELMCIALGHDIVEDTDVTYAQLRAIGMTERIIAGIQALTKVPGETYDEYKDRVKANPDAIRVKMEDLRHNSDLRRLKGVTEKDVARVAKYMTFYAELKELV